MRIRILNLIDRTSAESVFFFSSLHPKGVNVQNLVVVPKQPLQMPASICKGRDQLRPCCANVQSLRNKSPDVLCYACTMKTEIFAVTENWFSQHDIGRQIKESPPRFKMMNHSRVGRTSGGTTLLIKYSLLTPKCRYCRESVICLNVWNGLWTVNLIYRIPYSSKDPVTKAMFSEEFTNYLESFIMSPEPLLITGDFNIHFVAPNDIKHTRLLG